MLTQYKITGTDEHAKVYTENKTSIPHSANAKLAKDDDTNAHRY